MLINGVQFNAELKDIIQELRSQLIVNHIHLLNSIMDSGDDIMVACPYHKDGQERRPSAGIRKTDGKFHCFACGKTADLDEMVANCFGYNDPAWGYRWIAKNFLTVQVEEREPIVLNLSRTKQAEETPKTFVDPEKLDSYRYTHSYLYKRGMTDDIIERFDLGYDKDTDSITFPVRYWGSLNFGQCMFVAKRNIKTKRFDLPKNLNKPLYGLYEVWEDLTYHKSTIDLVPEVYVCEGLFDCLRLWCVGKYAVAGFGCLYSDYQMMLLEGLPTRKLVLAFDNDEAGKKGMAKLRKRIKNKLITEVVLPPGRKDIGECTDEELNNLEEVF